ncbi:unnamed protein product [Bursaphelenchus okinawaensis]|uniref:Uncharacterized protein n=1 Tax=Bursaphelenchus okinawaensis TaxID=465554 RepID=A0A811LIF8_9BILA|nr:unnamed protein product [Bursaphelenchus okinawaensis]CAG9124315.1 unnamed protein product [Bursaphelenchus okinawaensis]
MYVIKLALTTIMLWLCCSAYINAFNIPVAQRIRNEEQDHRVFASLLHFGEVVDLGREEVVDFRPRRPHRYATELVALPVDSE